jgi:intracellular sulfur oxidation DsrE/DsrF family protein
MRWRNLFILFVLGWAAQSFAETASMGPVIEYYGPAYEVAEKDVALPDGMVLRTVFDIAADPDPKQVNRSIVSVARFLNMHARAEVSLDNLVVAVVVHGKATHQMVSNPGNPNLELIRQLQEAGVRFYLCGQSMKFYGIDKDELVAGVEVGLSAMTMLTILQADDYALIPWGA